MAASGSDPTPPAESGVAIEASRELEEIRRRSEAMTESLRSSKSFGGGRVGEPVPVEAPDDASEGEVSGADGA